MHARLIRRAALGIALLAVGAGAAGAGASATALPGCRGGDLTGVFAVVPGSGAAGSISYRLRVVNRTTHTCFVTGFPRLGLVDRFHHTLPTHVTPSRPGIGLAVRVPLRPGASTGSTARFSPDVPGPGEPVSGRQCERKAYAIRYTPSAGGTLLAPVRPPTPVCEHGRLTVSPMGHS